MISPWLWSQCKTIHSPYRIVPYRHVTSYHISGNLLNYQRSLNTNEMDSKWYEMIMSSLGFEHRHTWHINIMQITSILYRCTCACIWTLSFHCLPQVNIKHTWSVKYESNLNAWWLTGANLWNEKWNEACLTTTSMKSGHRSKLKVVLALHVNVVTSWKCQV